MAQTKPEYEHLPELKKIADKLIQKYPEVLHGLDANSIQAVMLTNKDPKEGKPLWELKTVGYPIRLDVPYDYYVIVNSRDWEAMDEKHRAALTFDVLCSISTEEPGKTVPFDLKDHSVVIRTLGVDYMKREDIPDILNQSVNWKKE